MERDNEGGMAPGRSEVHTEFSTHPSKGSGMSGAYDAGAPGTREAPSGATEGARERVENARDELASRASGLRDEARGKVDELRERADEARGEVMERSDELRRGARETLDRARDEASRLRSRVQEQTDRALDRTGVRERIDAYPLVALGLAFGLGYMLAGKSTGRGGRVKTQIRSAVVGAVTAAAAHEVRSMLGLESGHAGGLGGIVDSMAGPRQSGGTARAGGYGDSASAYGA